MLKWIWRSWSALFVLILVTSMALNMVIATSIVATGAVTAMLGKIGVETVAGSQKKQLEKVKRSLAAANQATKRRAAVSRIASRVRKRTLVGSVRNVGSMFAEGIPFYGIAVIAAVTALELKDACETMRDMDEMAGHLETETPDEDVQTVCGMEVPDADEIWATVKESPEKIVADLRDRSRDLELPELPSLGPTWKRVVDVADRWLPDFF